MAESTLSLNLTDLEAEAGSFLGFGHGSNFSETAWSARQQLDITNCVKSGLRLFYFPTPLPGDEASYDWSFMRPTRQLAVVTGDREVALPDDFGGLEGDVRFVDSGKPGWPVPQTNEQRILQMYFDVTSVTGQPQWCAVKTGTGTGKYKGTRSTLMLYPEADADYTLQFQYYFLPDSLSVSFPYPQGGMVHAETMKAAVKAAAELYLDNQKGPMWEMFVDRMKASVSLDRRNKAQSLGYNADAGYNRDRPDYGWRHWNQWGNPVTYDGVTP